MLTIKDLIRKDGREPGGKVYLRQKFDDALINCYIKADPKSKYHGGLFYAADGMIRCHLENYAIIPRRI